MAGINRNLKRKKRNAAAPDIQLRKAIEYCQAGNWQAAEEACHELLRKNPRSHNALNLLSVALTNKRDLVTAENYLRQAIQIKPDEAVYYSNLGLLLKEQEKFAESLKAFEKACALNPRDDNSYFNLGTLYQSLQNDEQAMACYRKALAINPAHVQAACAFLFQTAMEYYQARNWQAAEEACHELLRKDPGSHKALNLLSVILTNKCDFASAESYLSQAIQVKPDEVVYYSNLGLLLKEQEKFADSLKAFEKACSLNPRDDNSFYNLGTLYQSLLNDEQAMACYRQALAINPAHVQAACTLCSHLRRKTDNMEELHRIMQHMKGLLSQSAIQDKEEIYFEFARAYDKLGKNEKVFPYLDEANRLFRAKFSHDGAGESRLFQSIRESFTPALLATLQDGGSDDPSPIFITGMPRSGTTLVEQILASHSKVTAGGELPFLNTIILSSPHLTVPFQADTLKFPDYSKISLVTKSDLKNFAHAYLQATAPLKKERERLTDKMPHNFIHIGMIRLLFPNSRVIHCRRKPLDNCLSLYMQNFKVLHPYIYSQEEIGEYYARYQALMDYWHELLPGFMHEIRYENLVQNPEPEMRRLLEFCGLEWEESCLEFYNVKRHIKTASQGQADQPLYTSSIGRWKKYEKQLQPLQRVLKEAGVIPS